MKGTSKEYAVALFGLAEEKKCEKEICDGLLFVRDIFGKTEGLYSFLKAPGISKSVRIDAVKSAFENSVPEYVLSFLCLLCENGNVALLDECIDEYEFLYEDKLRRSRAKVTSAVELSEKEKNALSSKLEKKYNRKIEIHYLIDSSILGGVIIEIDGTIIDGSLKSRLNTMKGVISE